MKLRFIIEAGASRIVGRTYKHDDEIDQKTVELLNTAKTGVPIKIPVVYRGQSGQIIDRSRGIFYTPLLRVAADYAKNGADSLGRRSHVIRSSLEFENPLVAESTEEVLQYLLDKSAISEKAGRVFLRAGAYGDMHGERIIAAGARKCGHDGIIYINFLNEIVDLR